MKVVLYVYLLLAIGVVCSKNRNFGYNFFKVNHYGRTFLVEFWLKIILLVFLPSHLQKLRNTMQIKLRHCFLLLFFFYIFHRALCMTYLYYIIEQFNGQFSTDRICLLNQFFDHTKACKIWF